MTKVLLLIVGTGSTHDKRESYVRLLKKAVESTEAENVYLLPSASKESQTVADIVKEDYAGKRHIQIRMLDQNGMEFDADKSFVFFNNLFQELFDKGFTSSDMIIDFTHGTKAMSAALYAVGMRYRISDFHYIVRTKDDNGEFKDEVVKNFDASEARFLALTDQCKNLFKVWQFSAVLALLKTEKPPKKLSGIAERIKMLAEFYAAWDRLDYSLAASIFPEFDLTGFSDFKTSPTVGEWIKTLAVPLKKPDEKNAVVLSENECSENARLATNILFDLYANGLRRLTSGQYEDASIRAYRIVEMIGQIELYKTGYVSSAMSSSDGKVLRFADLNHLHKDPKSDIYPPFGRKQVVAFLDYLKNPKVVFLSEIEKQIETRNNSILIHGYSATVQKEELQNVFDKLKSKLKEMCPDDFDEKFSQAMFMNKFAGDLDE